MQIKKERINCFHNNHTCYIMNMFLPWLVTECLYILEHLSIVGTAVNESIIASVPKQTDYICFSHVTKDTSKGFPHQWLSLAILRLACLDLAIDPKSQTKAHVNHTDTHHKLRQHRDTAAIYTDTYFTSFHIFMSELKRACWTRITVAGTLRPINAHHQSINTII